MLSKVAGQSAKQFGQMVKKYGLNMLMPQDESLQTYLRTITGQLSST